MSIEVNYYASEKPRYSPRGSKSLFVRLAKTFRDLEDYNELENTSDYLLRDMGITRSQISHLRRETLRWPYV